jgi:hypothetical protein
MIPLSVLLLGRICRPKGKPVSKMEKKCKSSKAMLPGATSRAPHRLHVQNGLDENPVDFPKISLAPPKGGN